MTKNRQKGDKYILRMPDGLRDIIKSSAKSEGRSMNSEIVLILQRYYAKKEQGE